MKMTRHARKHPREAMASLGSCISLIWLLRTTAFAYTDPNQILPDRADGANSGLQSRLSPSPFSPLKPMLPTPKGVSLTVQLKEYSNPRMMLDDVHTCVCTSGECLLVSPQGMGFRCLFTYMVIITSADNAVNYNSTPFLPLSNQGVANHEQTPKFGDKFEFRVNNQPMAINVFVYNLGPVINSFSKKLEQVNTLYQVDSFVVPLSENGGDKADGKQVTGDLLGTQLTLSYSVQCENGMVGPGCDLQCVKSTVNSANAVCQSKRTSFFSLCRWTGAGQVGGCQNCPWGIKDGAYCQDESGGVLEANHAGVVSQGYLTATIVLGCVAAALGLCLLFSLVLLCKSRSATNYRRHANGDEAKALTLAVPSAMNTPRTTNRQVPKSRQGYPLPLPPYMNSPAVAGSPNSSFNSAPTVTHSVSADV